MITLIYGDDLETSRRKLIDLKPGGGKAVTILNAEDNLNTVIMACSSQSLFGDKTFVVAEFSKSPNSEADFSFIQDISNDCEIIFWVGGNLPAKNDLLVQCRDVKASMLLFQKMATNSFKFVDALVAKNYDLALRELFLCLRKSDPLEILPSVVFQFRNLLGYKTKSALVLKLHPYVQKKSQTAVKRYTQEELILIYCKILECEVAIKTGTMDAELAILNLVEEICKKNTPTST
ncbi:MAG: hypothetical protein ABII16_02645 [Patescibacteria group bacterium]